MSFVITGNYRDNPTSRFLCRSAEQSPEDAMPVDTLDAMDVTLVYVPTSKLPESVFGCFTAGLANSVQPPESLEVPENARRLRFTEFMFIDVETREEINACQSLHLRKDGMYYVPAVVPEPVSASEPQTVGIG